MTRIGGMDRTHVLTATPDDWNRVRRLRLAALTESPDAFWTTLDQEAELGEDEWRRRLSDPSRITSIALAGEADDETVEAGLVMTGPSGEPAAAGLYGLWVAPGYRARGVGKSLIEAALRNASDLGYERILLDVGDHNHAAISLYSRLGFRPTGRTNRFPPPRRHITEHEMSRRLP